MRVWDLAAGYLNRGSLLGEHRELHGLRSILVNGKLGYSRHPETMRWVGCLSGLDRRHQFLAAEMRLRGYVDKTPVDDVAASAHWPTSFVTEPGDQIRLLKAKYIGKDSGRIPLPGTVSDLWANHKYSVLARDPAEYRRIGRRVSSMRSGTQMAPLAKELVYLLRSAPPHGCLVNALEHMWGYVADAATLDEARRVRDAHQHLFRILVRVALRIKEPYLVKSTALSDLEVFVNAA